MKYLNPEDQELVARIKVVQAQRVKANAILKKSAVGEDIGMLNSFLETKLHKSELLLHEASRKNNADVVRRLLVTKVYVDSKNKLDRTPLQWASANGGLETVKVLLEHGASMEIGDRYGMTPLLWAAWFGHLSVLKFLIACGASVDTQNKQGLGILHCAATQNHEDIIEFILTSLDDFNALSKDKIGRTAVHSASKEGNVKALANLCKNLRKPNMKDKNGQSAVHLAAIGGHVDCLETLILAGANIDDRDGTGRTCLHLAAEHGQTEIAEYLLKFDPDEHQDTPEESRENEASSSTPDAMGGSSASAAEATGKKTEESTKVEEEEGEKPKASAVLSKWRMISKPKDLFQKTETDKKEKEAIFDTVNKVLEDIAEQNAEITDKPELKPFTLKDAPIDMEKLVTALHIGADLGHAQFCRLLLQYGCNANVQNSQGNTPLHIASIHGFREIITDLVRYGAELDLMNGRGHTALHAAVERGQADSVEQLLVQGASTNIAEKTGRTPLSMAARASFLEIVDMIIKADLHTQKIHRYANISSDITTETSDGDPHTLRNIRHPHGELLKPILYRFAHEKMKGKDWIKLARTLGFHEDHLRAIEYQDNGEHSYKFYGYRVLMIWLHGVDPTENPVKELYEALVGIGRKGIAESLRRNLQDECGSETKKQNCRVS